MRHHGEIRWRKSVVQFPGNPQIKSGRPHSTVRKTCERWEKQLATFGENQRMDDFAVVIEHLKSQRIAFEEGLSDSEISTIETTCGFRFPPDLRRFIQIALPVSGGFPNWRSESTLTLQSRWINRPWDGISFDIEHNDFWTDKWGPKPATLEDAIAEGKRRFAEVPFLIPVRSHHYLPASPSLESNPVFRVRQTDVTVSGANLISFLLNEPISEPADVREIPFWCELTRDHHVIVPDLSASLIGRQEDYDQLVHAAKGAGFWAEVTAILDGKGVTFDRSPPDTDRRHGAFWMTRKTFGWLLCIRCPRFYVIPDTTRVTELCITLLKHLPGKQLSEFRLPFWNFIIDERIRRDFGLVAIKHFTDIDDRRETRLRFLEQLGWREMSDGQQDTIWERYSAVFHYPNRSGFRTPDPSITYDISAIYLQKDEAFDSIESDLSCKTLEALRKCTKPGVELLALDLNHPCYFFDPHVGFLCGNTDSWAVPGLPSSDHYIFLDQAFRFGIIGNCLDRTICVFGRQLLDAFAANQPLIFCRPTWNAEGRMELERIWETDGWMKLSVDEKDELWDEFDQRFNFSEKKGMADCPGITEPSPSMTWDVSETLTNNDEDLARIESGLKSLLVESLCLMTTVDERLFVLDSLRWFENYSFSPHQVKSVCTHQWPLPVFPKDNYTIILAANMQFGVFGNPLEKTFCIFGDGLLRSLQPHMTAIFGPPVRTCGM